MSPTFDTHTPSTPTASSLPMEIPSSSPLSDAPTVVFSPSSGTHDVFGSSLIAQTVYSRERDFIVEPTDTLSRDDRGVDNVETRRERLSTAQKLNIVVDSLRQTGWTFTQFLEAWVGVNEHQRVTVDHRSYHRLVQRRALISGFIRRLAELNICQEASCESVIAAELDSLINFTPFNTFSFEDKLEELNCKDAVSVIQTRAPSWCHLLRQLLVNRRANRPSYHSSREEPVDRRLFAVTSLVCFSRTKQRSNTFATCLDLYLQGLGVPRSVVGTLAGFGFCHSYRSGLGTMKSLAEHAQVRLIY